MSFGPLERGVPRAFCLQQTSALVWKILLYCSKRKKDVIHLTACLFSIKVGLTLSQRAAENKTGNYPLPLAAHFQEPVMCHTSSCPQGGA